MKNKVVINACFGGFGLSTLAEQTLLEKKNIKYITKTESKYGMDNTYFYNADIVNSKKYQHLEQLEWSSLSVEDRQYLNSAHINMSELERHDKDLIEVVEQLGAAASSRYAKLEVEEIEGNKYQVNEYDGSESIITPDEQTWTEIT